MDPGGTLSRMGLRRAGIDEGEGDRGCTLAGGIDIYQEGAGSFVPSLFPEDQSRLR